VGLCAETQGSLLPARRPKLTVYPLRCSTSFNKTLIKQGGGEPPSTLRLSVIALASSSEMCRKSAPASPLSTSPAAAHLCGTGGVEQSGRQLPQLPGDFILDRRNFVRGTVGTAQRNWYLGEDVRRACRKQEQPIRQRDCLLHIVGD
jgi:hypothetical protein